MNRDLNATLAGLVTSVYRIVVGFLFACHGAASLFGLFGSSSTPEFGAWPSWWAAVIELVGGTLVALGLFTRTAALICSGSMAFAYFTVHQKGGLLPIVNKGEPAAMFAWAFVLIAATGPGQYALGALVSKRPREEAPTAMLRQPVDA